MIDFDKVAKKVWQVLKSRGHKLQMFQANGDIALDPTVDARRFYIEDEGIMVTINEAGEDSEIKVYTSEESDLDTEESLLQNLRKQATFYGLNFNVRKYGKKLLPRQFSFLAHKVQQEEMNESLNFKNTDFKFRLPAGTGAQIKDMAERPKRYGGLVSVGKGVFLVNLNKVSRSDKGMITRKTNKGLWTRFKDYANGTIRVYVETDKLHPVEQETANEPLDAFVEWVNTFNAPVISEDDLDVDDPDEDLSLAIADDPGLANKIKDDPTVLNDIGDEE